MKTWKERQREACWFMTRLPTTLEERDKLVHYLISVSSFPPFLLLSISYWFFMRLPTKPKDRDKIPHYFISVSFLFQKFLLFLLFSVSFASLILFTLLPPLSSFVFINAIFFSFFLFYLLSSLLSYPFLIMLSYLLSSMFFCLALSFYFLSSLHSFLLLPPLFMFLSPLIYFSVSLSLYFPYFLHSLLLLPSLFIPERFLPRLNPHLFSSSAIPVFFHKFFLRSAFASFAVFFPLSSSAFLSFSLCFFLFLFMQHLSLLSNIHPSFSFSLFLVPLLHFSFP